MRAIRRSSPNLCRITLPNSRQPSANTKVPESTATEAPAASHDLPQSNPVNKRATPRLRARAHMYEPRGLRGSGYREIRPETTTPSRRSLVRRSQKYSGRPTAPIVTYAPYATQAPRFAYHPEWSPTTRSFSDHLLSASGLDPPPEKTAVDGNRLMETEKDLFAPQNLVPWL